MTRGRITRILVRIVADANTTLYVTVVALQGFSADGSASQSANRGFISTHGDAFRRDLALVIKSC